ICTGDPAVCNDSQLPIILLYFNATVDEAKRAVKLDWASYEEVNFDHFVLERSSDGLKFSEIGRINGGGWSQDVISYSFLDISPIHGRAYYRLRSVDFDGYEEIFIIKRIDYLQELPVFSVFPNPVTGSKIEVKFSVDPGVYGRLLVFNSVGEKVYTIPLSQGIFSYQIHNITQKGFLYFSVSMSDNIFTQQIWKR
ncbi:MAG: hypothetical protein OEX02_12960, partial [Cyclobacteriaceae bacterium]|nr:hypothetical protein [Cyclobacteriaceae bacterium]